MRGVPLQGLKTIDSIETGPADGGTRMPRVLRRRLLAVVFFLLAAAAVAPAVVAGGVTDDDHVHWDDPGAAVAASL
jgi:hypothetical protein